MSDASGLPFPPHGECPLELSIDVDNTMAEVEHFIQLYTKHPVQIICPNSASPSDSLLELCTTQGVSAIAVAIAPANSEGQ